MRFHDVSKAGLALALSLMLVQCHGKTEATHGDPVDLVAPPPPPAYGFGASVVLTAKAAAHLKAHPETLTVTAHYYGLPLPATQSKVDKDGVIDLGTSSQDLHFNGGPVTINGIVYPQSVGFGFDGHEQSRDALKTVAGGKALMQLKVTAQHKDLDCSRFQDYVITALSRPITLVCDIA